MSDVTGCVFVGVGFRAGLGGRWRLRHDPTGLKDGNIAVLTSFGDRLMDTVCRDACSGHDIARVRVVMGATAPSYSFTYCQFLLFLLLLDIF